MPKIDFETFIKEYGTQLLSCIVITVVGLTIIKILMKLIRKSLKHSKIDVTMHKFLLSMIRIVLMIILIVIVLQTLGVPMTSIIAVISVIGLAVSLAIQNSLSNVAGGMIILFSKPFELGNYVQIDNVEGTVVQISILHTKLNTIDNKAVYIPNGQVSAEKIINFSTEEKRRLELIFSIGYRDDFTLAQTIIKSLIEKNPLALTDPEPLVHMCEHGDSAIKILTRVWVNTDDFLTLKYDLLEEVKMEFDKNHISIPYNQLEVKLHHSTDES